MLEYNILSVKDLARYIKTLFDYDELLSDVWVKGEISNLTRHSSGHMYFSLKDETSQIKCVMWRENCSRLKFMPEEGMGIIANGSVSVYEKTGNYQFYIEEIRPDGIGALYMAYEQLKSKLSDEGLFDVNRKKTIPDVPERVALITSPTGAAVQDMISIMRRRFPGISILVIPTIVQGDDAPASIINSLNMANSIEGIDVIIIGRGGGSIEDLWCFNDEKVARAIANSRIPVVSAIGHETDFTIADFVSDLRAPTPSVAAELVAPDWQGYKNYIDSCKNRLIAGMNKVIDKYQSEIDRFAAHRVLKYPRDIVERRQQELDELSENLVDNIKTTLKTRDQKFQLLLVKLDAMNPLSVLNRGYTVIRRLPEKEFIKSVKQINAGDAAEILFYDGEASCAVTEARESKNE